MLLVGFVWGVWVCGFGDLGGWFFWGCYFCFFWFVWGFLWGILGLIVVGDVVEIDCEIGWRV